MEKKDKIILLIEDDFDIRNGIRILLESQGYEIIEAKNGREGLKKLNETISLVILDIIMPEMSGIEVCKKIRESWYVPILFLTAKSSETDKLEGFSAGGDDYLVKIEIAEKYYYENISALCGVTVSGEKELELLKRVDKLPEYRTGSYVEQFSSYDRTTEQWRVSGAECECYFRSKADK